MSFSKNGSSNFLGFTVAQVAYGYEQKVLQAMLEGSAAQVVSSTSIPFQVSIEDSMAGEFDPALALDLAQAPRLRCLLE